MLAEIDSLDNGEGCFATNEYFADFMGLSKDRARKIMSSLKDKGYVDVNLKYKIDTKEIEERQIIPIVENINRYSEKDLKGIGKNNYSGSQKQLHPIGENDKDIINNIKNKNNYNKELQIKKNNKANFEQRDYTGFDFTKLYANADAFL